MSKEVGPVHHGKKMALPVACIILPVTAPNHQSFPARGGAISLEVTMSRGSISGGTDRTVVRTLKISSTGGDRGHVAILVVAVSLKIVTGSTGKKRNRLRQENDMVDSAPQWEAVLRRQKEKNQADPNYRRSRHRSRSRSPDVQAKEALWKHIQKELVDPSGLSEEQLKEIPYMKIETQGDPIRIRHSHSPRSFRQYRRSQCSDGERSVLSEVNAKNDLVPPLTVTRASDTHCSSGPSSQQRRNGSKDSLIDPAASPHSRDGKHSVKTIKTVQSLRLKSES